MLSARTIRSLILLLLALPLGAHGQSGWLRKGDKAYARYTFPEAIAAYERAFAAGATDLEAARRLAEGYRQIRDLPSSEQWYALIASGPGATAEDLYRYSSALRSSGRYAEADSVMLLYAAKRPDDARAARLMHTATLQPWLLVDPLIDGMAEPVPWNSEELDMAPALWGDQVIFASSRPRASGVEHMHEWDGMPFLDLYAVHRNTVEPLKGPINTRFHESNTTFAPNGREMYFNRNSYHGGRSEKDKEGFANLMIYRAELVNGIWTNETPFPYNDPAWSTGHPSLNSDGSVLYFSSNRPGGQGGVDIWRCLRDSLGNWGPPENLGAKVNTPGDELFPTTHGPNTLFFSSDGHPGLGGLDVFVTRTVLDGFRSPMNVGAPVNSRWDDMSLVLTATGDRGYFCSNRNDVGGRANIHHLTLDQPYAEQRYFSGILISDSDGKPLEHLPVRILDLERRVIARTVTGIGGHFEFLVSEEPAMIAVGEPGPREFVLVIDDLSMQLTDVDFMLEPIRIPAIAVFPLVVMVSDSITGEPLPSMNVRITEQHAPEALIAAGTTGLDGIVRMYLRTGELGGDIHLLAHLTPPTGAQRSSARSLTLSAENDLYMHLKYFRKGRNTHKGAKPPRTTHGRIVDSSDGLPLAKVPVDLLDAEKNLLANGLTDAAGRYAIATGSVPAYVQVHIPGTTAVIKSLGSMPDQPDFAVQGHMDLPVNTVITDRSTGEPLPGVTVKIADRRTNTLLLTGTTDATGILRGTIPDRRYGSEENLRITFSREDFVPHTEHVDFTVLTFLELSLVGLEPPKLTRYSEGVDLAGTLSLPTIHFDYNEARIRPDAEDHLARVAQVLLSDPTLKVDLRAHTDSRGSAAFNRFLSQRRAENARAFLIAQGVSPSRLTSKGMGESALLNHCSDNAECSEEEHQVNRRIEFIATKVKSGR